MVSIYILGSFILLMLFKMPIALSMAISSLIGLLIAGVPMTTVPQWMAHGVHSYPLMAIPFFIFAGGLLNVAGLTSRIFNFANVFVSRLPGGLAQVAIIAEMIFSGISGSTAADISAIGSLLIAPMERAGYSKGEAVAIVSAATAMGILVPPCIFMIVLASMTNQSIGAMFVAGFLPAIVIGLGLGAYIYWKAGKLGIPREAKASWGERLRALGDGVIAMVMPGIIFGSIFGGVTTVTEAAVIAVLYSAFVGMVIYKRIAVKDLPKIILASTINTSMCMLLIGSATIFSWVMTVERVPQTIGKVVMSISNSPWFFLLLSNVIFAIFGAVLEGLPAMIVFVPVMYPIAAQFGIDPLHYGILIIASIGIGVFLPPIGVGLFIACAIARLSIVESTKYMAPYLVILFIGLLVITYVPWFTLVLPKLFLR